MMDVVIDGLLDCCFNFTYRMNWAEPSPSHKYAIKFFSVKKSKLKFKEKSKIKCYGTFIINDSNMNCESMYD